MDTKPTIICVDDEVNILEGMKMNLRKVGRILTAESGTDGLKLLQNNPQTAVVVSDMRMPEMDGAAFLAKAHAMRPEAVRILLTGFADMDAAVRAVNDGQLFRFLTKPCPPEMLHPTIEAALDQHRLITAEKELLQNTLMGSVNALVELLALDNPKAMGRAMRIKARVRKIGPVVGVEPIWPVEFAALFSQLGIVALPGDIKEALFHGKLLENDETETVSRNVESIIRIVSRIPRLGPAIDILRGLLDPPAADDSLEIRVLRSAMMMEACESSGLATTNSLVSLRARIDTIGEEIVAAYAAQCDANDADNRLSVAVDDLREGMSLTEDLNTGNGVLVAPRGLVLNAAALEHIANFAERIGDARIEVVADASHSMTVEATPEAANG